MNFIVRPRIILSLPYTVLYIQPKYSWRWAKLSPKTCTASLKESIKQILLHLVGCWYHYGGQSDTMTGFSMSTSVFTVSVSFHSRYHCCQLVFPYSDYQVRLSKILNAKKSKIKVLREMNTEAERKKSFGSYIPEDFQRRYASVIIDLEHLNRDLQDYLTNVQKYCQEVSSYQCFYLCMLCVQLLLHTS